MRSEQEIDKRIETLKNGIKLFGVDNIGSHLNSIIIETLLWVKGAKSDFK